MNLIEKIVYWLATALMGTLMLFAVQMYVRNPEAIAMVF